MFLPSFEINFIDINGNVMYDALLCSDIDQIVFVIDFQRSLKYSTWRVLPIDLYVLLLTNEQ